MCSMYYIYNKYCKSKNTNTHSSRAPAYLHTVKVQEPTVCPLPPPQDVNNGYKTPDTRGLLYLHTEPVPGHVHSRT